GVTPSWGSPEKWGCRKDSPQGSPDRFGECVEYIGFFQISHRPESLCFKDAADLKLDIRPDYALS
ncbi:MAG: hypothetical protein RQ801_14125, partial [Spirochaetaceae bacterium]|nr:hypothetical protein [Spirochaetaceae bacterium]